MEIHEKSVLGKLGELLTAVHGLALLFFCSVAKKILFGIWYLVTVEMGNVESIIPCIIYPIKLEIDESVIYSDKLHIMQVLH